MSKRNLTLLTDLYELTMMQGYYEKGQNENVIFDVFFRQNPCNNGYSVCAGLDQVIDYIKNLHFTYDDVDYLRGLGIFKEDFLHYLSGFHFSGDIYAIPEGTVVFPKEPLLKVVAPIMEAQLVETAILNIINHQSDRNQDFPYRIRSQWRRYHGIRPSPCPGTGCRIIRCKSSDDRRMCRYFQCTCRTDVRRSCYGNPRAQLDHEFPG